MFKKLSLTTVLVTVAALLLVGILAVCGILIGDDVKNQGQCEANGGTWTSEVTGYVSIKGVITPVYSSHCETAK